MWLAGLIGLTWPVMAAVDQLVRHPAMTPKKLALWYAPFLVCSLVAIVGGMARAVGCLLAGFSAVLMVVAGAMWRRLPPGAVKSALAMLMVAAVACAAEGVARAIDPSGLPWMWPEALVMTGVWRSFRAASRAAF